MTIENHPPLSLLSAFAAGTLDQGQHVAVATHLTACATCRTLVRGAEGVGGEILDGLAPSEMAPGALAAVMARLDQAEPPHAEAADELPDLSGLPRFVRRYPFGQWQAVGGGVAVRRIAVPGPTRVFLLKGKPGTRLPRHTHSGFEMTCVLAGGFSHDGRHFNAGDFDFGDRGMEHAITLAPGGDCISLVAMQGSLRLMGLVGRLLQPFVRL